MAHIITCMADVEAEQSSLKTYIAKQLSTKASTDSLDKTSVSSCEEKKSFVWRMHQPEARKYQLFPKEKQLPHVTVAKKPDPEQVSAVAFSQNSEEKPKRAEKPSLRSKIKEHNLGRRRKVSLADLGPMTTVQEVPMDSPTIPGRPPLHERSISSPVNTLNQSAADAQDGTDENVGLSRSSSQTEGWKWRPGASNQPPSPKSLAPLVIPGQNMMDRLAKQLSLSRGRSGSAPVTDVSSVHAAIPEESPMIRTPFTPYTPGSANVTTPMSAVTATTLPTPVSARTEFRESPTPGDNMTPVTTPHLGSLESTPKLNADLPLRSGTAMSHKRNQSETGSIMERGRPRKRSDGTAVGVGIKRTGSKKSKSAERRAFEVLPQGHKPTDVLKVMEQSEAEFIHQQALGQALRFEVLTKDDVEAMSRELRHLDERTDYLRRTYTSLRAGRRNLHSRICQYLRSPRTAKFNNDSILKQEEALAELDNSIDDWFTKLEQAENRRTRVRQKLLEHVAAAATMLTSDVVGAGESLHLAMSMRAPNGANDVSTPPRSPRKTESLLHAQSPSPSPQRVVAKVPSVIPEAPGEEAATVGLGLDTGDADDARSAIQRMESIRIYANSDVYELLADVENEFTKLGGGEMTSPEPSNKDNPFSEQQRKELHRERSQEMLINGSPVRKEIQCGRSHETLNSTPVVEQNQKKLHRRGRSHELLNSNALSAQKRTEKLVNKAPPMSPPAPSPPAKDSPTEEAPLLLTAAVFQPGTVAAKA